MTSISSTCVSPLYVISSPCCQRHSPSSMDCSGGDLCSFHVAWKINPHMKVGETSVQDAFREHHHFNSTLRELGASVIVVPFIHGSYDSVFVKDNAVLREENGALLAFVGKPRFPQRQLEQAARVKAYSGLGFEIAGYSPAYFEGGDFVFLAKEKLGFLGYGFRTEKSVSAELADFMNSKIIDLELVDPYFYHLDTALAVVNGTPDGIRSPGIFYYPEAFSPSSQAELRSLNDRFAMVPVSRSAAMSFGLNWVEINNTMVLGGANAEISALLQSFGKKVVVSPLTQFLKAGGSAACLTSRIYTQDRVYAQDREQLRA